MKELLLVLLFLLPPIWCKGQNKYLYYNLEITGSHVSYKTDGDAPSGLKNGNLRNLGEFLDALGNHGYKLEKFSVFYRGEMNAVAILSKNTNQNETYSYVSIIRMGTNPAIVTGDVPSGNNWENSTIDALLSELGNYSYELDFHLFNQYIHNNYIENHQEVFILSKRDTGSSSMVRHINSYNNDSNEIARYNLEGVVVDRNYKGTQIIVYSDYTTKIIKVK